ncbi:MAG: Rne/Rng family ribonuclease [Lentisphaeria bacterium]|nr:Rne/Rng family ribonuclease [Lentisphaeria bacterium]
MEKDNIQILLNCEHMESRFALIHDGKLEEYQIERKDNDPKVGDIYLGRIVNLDPLLQAAFVDIGAPKNAFLHFHEMLPGYPHLVEVYRKEQLKELEQQARSKAKNKRPRRKKTSSEETVPQELPVLEDIKITQADIPRIFKPGMNILVQVVKGPISTKGARITTDLSIPGRFLVLMPNNDHIGLSTKIEGAAERERLRKILDELKLPEGMGLICRTVGEGRRSTFFKRDLNLLLDYWQKITEGVNENRAPKLLYTEPDLIDRTIRDFVTDEIGGIIVDDKEVRKHIIETFRRIGVGKMAGKVVFYNGTKPIFEEYKINDQLKTVFQREVRLPSGGGLCIDETEALIAIDVNTGKGKNGTDQPEFILKTNLEAADEIARQLRLRNIGGLVVLDFIDMRTAKDRDELYRYMKKLVKNDRAKTKVLPLSKLGLMEMTRQREQESILDQVYTPCPYCRGRGLIKSVVTMSAEIQRRLNSVLRDKRFKDVEAVRVFMHPEVLARLRNEDAAFLQELEEKYKHELSFRADPTLHYEEFRLVDPETDAELR